MKIMNTGIAYKRRKADQVCWDKLCNVGLVCKVAVS